MPFPASTASVVYDQLLAVLAPHCDRITFAGSLRRQKPKVGDLEILYIPKFVEHKSHDLFDTDMVNQVDLALDSILRQGILSKRPNVNGTFAWGEKNKLALHNATVLPVDLFSTNAESWHNYLVCRTGPAELNTLIATRARARGWKWNPYASGFSSLHGLGHKTVTCEADVFSFVGLPNLQPHERTKDVIAAPGEVTGDFEVHGGRGILAPGPGS